MRLPGFEPRTTGSEGRLGAKSSDKRDREYVECWRILREFKDYLIVDRQLEKGTVERHISELERLFKVSGFNPLKATKSDIRNYLRTFKDIPANTYANILKTLRIFYRDYLGRREVIEGFKFPNRPFKTTIVPSKKDPPGVSSIVERTFS